MCSEFRTTLIYTHSLQYTIIAHFRSSYVEASFATRIYSISFCPDPTSCLSSGSIQTPVSVVPDVIARIKCVQLEQTKHNREWLAKKQDTGSVEGAFALGSFKVGPAASSDWTRQTSAAIQVITLEYPMHN